MTCPLEDVGNENQCEDCEGEAHERRISPTFGRQSNYREIFLPSLVSGSSASVTYFVVERVHRLPCTSRRPHVVLSVLAWSLHIHPRIFRALVPNSASCNPGLVLYVELL